MNTFEILQKKIAPILSLTDDEWEKLIKAIQIRTLGKNEYLLRQGRNCDFIAFVNSGVLVYIKELENSDELSTDFAFEGEWVTDNQSRLSNSLSYLNIKSLEDSELLVITHKKLEELYIEIPKLEKLGRILMEEAFVKIAQHSIDLQVLSAKERYLKLLDKYPLLFQKVPQYHIANYLGIAPKSLSRIRKEICQTK